MNKVKFRTKIGYHTFQNKYAAAPDECWSERARVIVDDVCGTRGGTVPALLPKDEREQLVQYITNMWFLPGGRYIYYAGRKAKFFNNCFLFRAEEDTREEWARLAGVSMNALMSGGGIGIDYSRLRHEGAVLSRTGGLSSGPVPLMCTMNEIGRNVMQGGSRRSAIYASLDREHNDIHSFLRSKNWHDMPVGKTGKSVWDIKQDDFNYHAPLDMTNISVNYSDEWLNLEDKENDPVFKENVRHALSTGEPGFSFNFEENKNETLRNACTEVTSEDDSDVCNLGSVNMGAIECAANFADVVMLGAKFLVCGTIRGTLPSEDIKQVREKNRRIGLGLMGMHEWLLRRSYSYTVTEEMHNWLDIYETVSEYAANSFCDQYSLNRPVKYRAIAPTGTIGILAGTTTGIEPLYAVAYKRRYLANGTDWKYEYVVDSTAEHLIDTYGTDPDKIDTALKLAEDPWRRLKFQYDVQSYVDHAISSTINLPPWGSEGNNESHVDTFAEILADFAPGLRGFTCYPDGARGGQPLTEVPYKEAVRQKGVVFEENDVCSLTGKGGTCGV